MIGSIHDESDPSGNLAKFTNDQFVAREIEMIQYVFLKIEHIIRVVVISIIPDDDLWVFDDIFEKAGSGYTWDWVERIRIRKGGYGHIILTLREVCDDDNIFNGLLKINEHDIFLQSS